MCCFVPTVRKLAKQPSNYRKLGTKNLDPLFEGKNVLGQERLQSKDLKGAC